jgi:7-carboxy-7-deazaguanine synthase
MLVLEIFDSIQGEGTWSGVPMTFVRLAGCNGPELGLGCVRWCDTPQSWDRAAGKEMTVEAVAAAVRLPRVCVTGGEPLLQAEEVRELVDALRRVRVRVHLETNGTLPLAEGTRPLWVTVSPKSPDYAVHPALAPRVDELKFVLDREIQLARVEEAARLLPHAQVCLQPEASAGLEGVKRTIAGVMGHGDWRLSLQMHKLIGLR